MSTSAGDLERELKLSMKIGVALPDLRNVVGATVRQPDQNLHAVYLDSSDLRLWARGVTLRHRTGEATPQWTLKLPSASTGDLMVRTELNLAGDEKRIPDEFLDVLSGVVRRAPLRRVAELDTERVRFLLEKDGATWAELTSDVVTIVGGHRDGRRFRQLELEMVSGDSKRDRGIKAVVNALQRVGARPDPEPKLEKALGPRERPRKLSSKSSTEEVARAAISSGLGRLLDHDPRIRVAGTEVGAEDVHQARVATRRLRSDLGTLQKFLDPFWVRHVRGDLRSVGSALGAVRDIDVLTRGLSEAGADSRLMQILREERTSAVRELLEMMNGGQYLDLLDRLHAASSRPPVADRRLARRKARRSLPKLVDRRWKKLRKDARKAQRRPADDQLHRLRKRSKQLRYASELATPVIGKSANRTARASESLQTLLGDYHDAVVASQWLRRTGNRGSIEGARDVASLLMHECQIRDRLGRKWRSRYRRLAEPRHRAWLKGDL